MRRKAVPDGECGHYRGYSKEQSATRIHRSASSPAIS
jgi:hypothetical protein